jgi:ABC-type nitrate/sulfonate/bicarbonate transport system permease component
MRLFTLRGDLNRHQTIILGGSGVALILILWFILTAGTSPILVPAILPSPLRVVGAFGDLFLDNDLIRNTCRSIGINLAGYMEAILLALPLGFLVGLIPLFWGSFQRPFESIRYVPLTAVTGLFIVWFGVGTSMKVHFLAFGILIYLLPVIIQRIQEVDNVYLRTVYTLGASPWMTFRTVYWPAVISKLSDDIRVLTAISWTYIIVAENIDSSQGGLGALIWRVGQRQGRMDKVFALLILIILIGVLQDQLFKRADLKLFPHKNSGDLHQRNKAKQEKTLYKVIYEFFLQSMMWIFIGLYWLIAFNDLTGLIFPGQVISDLFGHTAWAIHLLMLAISVYQVWYFMKIRRSAASKLTSSV